MQKYIVLYLKFTGLPAAVALLFPSLVLLGTYLLIVPGLVLGSAPTAFLWGSIFAAFWFALKTHLGDTAATALIAAVLTALMLFVVTQPFRSAGHALYRQTLLPQVTPSNPIAMTGDIRIDLPRPQWDNRNNRGASKQRGFSCSNLCVALLFTPGVKSVTINKSGPSTAQELDPEARTYWLVPKTPLESEGLLPDLEGGAGLFPASLEERKALSAKWQSLLADDFCLRRSAPLATHDIRISHHHHGAATRFDKSWSLSPRVFETESIEIQDASGGTLLRRSTSSVYIPTRLLFINFEGGPASLRSGWGRTTLTNQPRLPPGAFLQQLEQHTNTRGK